jgi:hypothetical protein
VLSRAPRGVRRLGALVVIAVAGLALSASAQARSERAAACPAPKKLPASLKLPAASASPAKLASFLLALPPRKPCDVNLFTSKYVTANNGFYPEGSSMQPAAGPVPSEAEVRAQLDAYLQGSPEHANALRVFDDPAAKAKISSPTILAAFAALYGTAGESTVDLLLGAGYSVRFGGIPQQEAVAMVAGAPNRIVLFNRRYESEHFALQIGVIAHEILHHDAANNATEEAILNATTALIHMQVLNRHPELAHTGTELSRQLNDLVLLFVNSRAPGASRSAIVAAAGKGIAPGSARSQPDFLTFFLKRKGLLYSDASVTPPAPPAFASVLREVLAPGVAIPAPLLFDKPTASLFSRTNDRWLSPVERLRVSVLLGLVSMDEITAYTKLSRAKATATFKLAPVLAAMR